MPEQAKIEGCPMPGCGGEVMQPPFCVFVTCRECAYEAPTQEAHNHIALAARLFPRACELLRELHAVVSGECPSLFEELSGGDAELAIDIEDILAEAQGVADAE